MTVVPIPSLVKGQPPQVVHVLRRQPLYDRELVGGSVVKADFFLDCHKFADGRMKTRGDTNMSQCSQLGRPLQYDLAQVGIYPTAETSEYAEKYHRFVHSDTVMRVVFGSNVTLFEVPVALMKPMNQSLYVRDADTGNLMRVIMRSGKVEAHPVEYPPDNEPLKVEWETKVSLTPRWHSVAATGKDGKLQARRIDSDEAFRVEMSASRHGERGWELEVYVAFDGWLYSVL